VLLLGALFDSLTILHHAEHIADVPNKRTERYRWPLLRGDKCQWVEFEQLVTISGTFPGNT
jgi:aminoglycoside 3-N-acetyltransferase